LPRGLDEAAGVDDDDIGAVGFGDERVAVLRELAEHAFGIDEIFRTAEADESESGFVTHSSFYIGLAREMST
jgi:hypothetical protein